MEIVTTWSEIVNWLIIKCECGEELKRLSNQEEVRCPKCGDRAKVRDLRERSRAG